MHRTTSDLAATVAPYDSLIGLFCCWLLVVGRWRLLVDSWLLVVATCNVVKRFSLKTTQKKIKHAREKETART